MRPATVHPPFAWRIPAWGILIAGAALYTYGDSLAWLVQSWADNPNYSHGPLIPVIAGYLIYRRRAVLWPGEGGAGSGGLVLLALSVLLEWVSVRAQVKFAGAYSMILFLLGALWYLGGGRRFRALWFPLAFLFFMVPFWVGAVDRLGGFLKLAASRISCQALQGLGYSVYRQGVILHFPAGLLEVADPCSGIRSLFALLALCALMAHLSQGSRFKKLTLVALALPLAVCLNALRILLLGIVLSHTGVVITEGLLHTALGILVFGLALLGLMLVERKARF